MEHGLKAKPLRGRYASLDPVLHPRIWGRYDKNLQLKTPREWMEPGVEVSGLR